MSLVPAFEIGLWNAWVFMVLLLATTTALPLLMDKEKKMDKRVEGEPTWGEQNKTAKVSLVITHMVIMPFTLLYSVFLPLKLGTLWFVVGLPICLFGLAMGLMFSISFMTAPLGEPITTGVYAISRNPGYLAFFLVCVGIGIAYASWVFLLCALVWIVTWHFGVVEEERVLLKRYGDAYREYMNRTPRWIGFPKVN
jgi:protein-S-isoprenylcysteine O-methyltransferase Ste14